MTEVQQKPPIQRSDSTNWMTLFDDVDTSCGKSCLFMKKMVALGVSNILYWRGLLPESAFGERVVAGNTLKVLRNEKECPAALKIISWIKSSFVPISKRWLRNFYLVVKDEQNKMTVEYYTFRFQYTDDGEVHTEISRNNNNKQMIEGKTMELLSNIAAIAKPLGPAPFPCRLSVDMDFHHSTPDNVIPDQFEVSGFYIINELQHEFDGKRVAVPLGNLNTKYHDCRLQIRTTAERLSLEGYKSKSSQNQQEESQQPVQPNEQKSDQLEQHQRPANTNSRKRKRTEPELNCICELSSQDFSVITCCRCEGQSHTICYGYLDLGEIPDQFTCYRCDEVFSHDDLNDLSLAAQVRRFLYYREQGNEVSTEQIVKDSDCVKKTLVQLKACTINKKTSAIRYNKRKLDGLYDEYFPVRGDLNNATLRLIKSLRKMSKTKGILEKET